MIYPYASSTHAGGKRGFARLTPLLAVLAFTLGVAPILAADGDAAVQIDLLTDTAEQIELRYEIGDYAVESVAIDGHKHAHIFLGKEAPMKTLGAPALPKISRSIIIPDDARMGINVLDSTYHEIQDIKIAPSKGFIPRTVNPGDVPYTFGEVYNTDAFYPGEVATLRDPYILRDQRGTVIDIFPFQYNPATRTLRVYTDVTVEVVGTGPGQINVLTRPAQPRGLSLAFHTIYRHHFLNYEPQLRYVPLDETGDMLIICHDAWLSNIQPLVDHKTARGINTTAVGVATIGNNSTSIKNYIQGVYSGSDLAFVLLVGDGAQVATPYASGGSADPIYSKLAGGDHYPDIIVGRFSAQSPGDVDTQVERTIEYETMPAVSQDWFWRGTGIASNQGPGDDGEYDNVHIDNIRDDLLANGYTLVDRIYDPSGTASQVTAALNNGRGIINYTGHGSTTSWSSTGFSNSHVNALVNDSMLPFIVSVACVNGQFDGPTCFGEAWLRATHDGEPTGAIGAYMSSINQSWDPPMEGQDEFNLLYVDEAYASYGTLCYAGSCSMMDEYGSGGVEMFDTWHIFGDPSVKVVMSCVDAGTIVLDSGKYACEDTVSIIVNDCGLNTDDGALDTVIVTVSSDSEPAEESVLLTELDPAAGQFTGSIQVSATNSTGVLAVAEGDTITATYIDENDGAGGIDVVVTDTANVDCTAPNISNVQAINIEPRNATVTFDADEPARGTVNYGYPCTSLDWSASGSGYAMSPAVGLAGLQDDTMYYFTVEAEDEAGNTVTDDNGGECYWFSTPEVPDYFTEQFEGDADLDGLSLSFSPNGSNDFYDGCAEEITALPTDPAGGTPLSFSPSTDDGYATLSLTGGATVSLYGTSYGTFFPGSNGYITFVHGETGYSESLETHFGGVPRISAMFDDLNPSAGGTVSWKQLSDRAVVTWQNVPKYYDEGSNTFQIEMFFDGTITISYLGISDTEFIAGLSAGTGLDPDFYESDLSAMGECVPPGDCDVDGDIDEDDYAVLVDCFSGPGGGVGEGCGCVDMDGDYDVDCKDYNLFGLVWNGTGDLPTFGPCAQPVVVASGGRYLAVTPAPGSDPVALLVTGDPLDAEVSCISLYVQADGSLGTTPVFRPPAGPDGWNTVQVFGGAIMPNTLYNVQGDYGAPGNPMLSPPRPATTMLWGDAECNFVVNFTDVQWTVLAYEGTNYLAPFEALNIAPCDLDDTLNFTDIQAVILSFEGTQYRGTICTPPCQ